MARGVIQGIKNNGRALVMFLLGVCTGAAFFLILYAEKLDGLYRERDAIYYANNQKYKEIMKLKEEMADLTRKGAYRKNYEETIKKIEVEIDSEQPIGPESDIKSKVEEMMKPFIDKPMDWVIKNPDMVALVLRQPIAIDKEQKFQLSVKYLSFYHSTLRIWVHVEEISDEGVSDSPK